MKKVFGFLFLLNFIYTYDSAMPILQDDFKTDVEYIFEKGQNFTQIYENEDSIRKYFHFFKENEINLNSGARFKCYVPSKLKADYQENIDKDNKKMDIVPDHLISQIMRIPSRTCYTLNVKEWFYKLCPLKLSQQTLAYNKKNEQGEDYVEKFVLGFSKNLTKLTPYQLFLQDNTTNLNKLILKNFTTDSFVITEGHLAKVFNFDLASINDFEYSLVVFYNHTDFDLSKDKNLRVNQNFTLEEYLKDNPESSTIPFERKVIRSIGKHMLLLSAPFPLPIVQIDAELNTGKQKTTKEIEHSFNLNIFKEFIHCSKCEFLTFYSIGDTFFLKNSKYTDNQIHDFKGKSYQGRVITEIINNNLIKVHKPFGKFFQISTLRSNYFVIDSFGKKYRWKGGIGYIKSYKNLIFGFKTNFLKDVNVGEYIYFINTQRNNAYYHHTTTNPKLDEKYYCLVKKIINRNLIITDKSCVIPNDFKGTYFISKSYSNVETPKGETKLKENIGLINLNNEENKNKISNARREMYRPTLKLNHEVVVSPIEEDTSKFEKISPSPNSTVYGIIDFHLFEEISFNRISSVFYSHRYISHKGLILKRPHNSVLRMKLTKTDSTYGYLRMIFSTNLEDYTRNSINENTDYELIIQSEMGIALKKINNLTTANSNTFQFLDMDIRSFFHETTNIDIIFLNKTIYINSNDDDFDSSIKIHIELPDYIRFISFDSMKSNNIEVKMMRMFNFVEAPLIYNIYVYEKKHLLGENSTYIEEQTNGDYCDELNNNRTSVIEYKCDKSGNYDIIIDSVEELSTCRYKYTARSRFMCNPYELMKMRIMKSIARTKCYVKNNFYYNDSKELISKLV